MVPIRVVLEGAGRCEVFSSAVSVPEIMGRIAVWLASAEARTRESGVCKSFTVGIHVETEDCDHGPFQVKRP